ncbi:hypothetical protein [Flavobacterium cupreum]|uniref:hypothetical protein n=1 Tax=Flavobacterium cupreum TaxID=2133766 RepID=UPI001375B9D1
MRNQTDYACLFVVNPQHLNPKLLGLHYTIWGGCQILPQKLEVRTEWYEDNGFLIRGVLSSKDHAITGVVLRTCAAQQLHVQKGGQRSDSFSCDLLSVLDTISLVCAIESLCSESAQGKDDSTIKYTDNMMLIHFTGVKIRINGLC